MPGSRTNVAREGPQSRKGSERKADFRALSPLRKSETLTPGAALQALRLGARLSPEQAAALSHAVGNRALEELLSASDGPELLRRPLPTGDLQTPPLSVPDSAPDAPLMTLSPVWDESGADESNAGAVVSASAGESNGGVAASSGADR